MISAIIYEEMSHQGPFEYELNALGLGDTVGVGQMTVYRKTPEGPIGFGTREQLLDPVYTVNAMAQHVWSLRQDGYLDPQHPYASLATK